jgi:hypothetical protein
LPYRQLPRLEISPGDHNRRFTPITGAKLRNYKLVKFLIWQLVDKNNLGKQKGLGIKPSPNYYQSIVVRIIS